MTSCPNFRRLKPFSRGQEKTMHAAEVNRHHNTLSRVNILISSHQAAHGAINRTVTGGADVQRRYHNLPNLLEQMFTDIASEEDESTEEQAPRQIRSRTFTGMPDTPMRSRRQEMSLQGLGHHPMDTATNAAKERADQFQNPRRRKAAHNLCQSPRSDQAVRWLPEQKTCCRNL